MRYRSVNTPLVNVSIIACHSYRLSKNYRDIRDRAEREVGSSHKYWYIFVYLKQSYIMNDSMRYDFILGFCVSDLLYSFLRNSIYEFFLIACHDIMQFLRIENSC
jgi:hypothetical protein